MELILIDDVYELGRRGDVVHVADGYARNYLLPRHLAVLSTPGNQKMVEQQRLALAKKEAHDVEAAELVAQQLGQLHILVSRKCGETGVLFGSVTSKDLEGVLEACGYTLDRRRILLPQPLKQIGNFTVEARPHPEVQVQLLVSVLPEVGEAVARAMPRGEESDKILNELAAKVSDLGQKSAVPATGGRAAGPVEEQPAEVVEPPSKRSKPRHAEESPEE